MLFFLSYDRVVEPVSSQAFVGVDSGVGERSIFVSPEREDRLIHVEATENLPLNQEVKVFNGEAGHSLKEAWFKFRDEVCQCVSRKSVRYINAGILVANLISLS